MIVACATFYQEEKMCKQCKKVFPVSKFYNTSRGFNPYDVYCKECRKEKSLEYYFEKGSLNRRKKRNDSKGKRTIV